ncbi:O-antigen ligase [Lysinibacillus sp. SGAir0095]|uniref:O-antigen ligase family protein n=1 Tax=Lysinibacillus sp. SGAir0095 TaxID=2070463 RepID=UPI0010CD52F8|nr:O-antigen ligase family protein [Lysinibacillus sp. SGAir0095]QCR31986.1 hypothetical protein C1N55_07290 [Lysinibacillus sp. SGAir0095]
MDFPNDEVAQSKEDLEDKKISMVILSSTVILTVQFFLLISFDLMDSSLGSMVQTLSKGLVGILLLYTFPIILKRSLGLFIVVYYIAILIFSLHYLLFPQNQEYMSDLIFPFFFMCLPIFIYSRSLENWGIFKQTMTKASVIIFVLGLILGIQIVSGAASVGDYSMTLSYYLLLPSIIFVDKLLDQFSISSLVVSVLSIVIILSIGSRGAIMCIGVFVLLKLIKPNAEIPLTKSRVFLYIVLLVSTSLILLNFKSILLSIDNLLGEYGIHSRSIRLFLAPEVSLSGREGIYEKVLAAIGEHPILGIGLAGDRQITNGVYAHNLLLEVLINFGVVLGSLLIVFLLVIMLKTLFVRDLKVYNMLIMWISIGLVSLFVSGSYLTELNFWIFLGLILSYYKQKSYRKTRQ